MCSKLKHQSRRIRHFTLRTPGAKEEVGDVEETVVVVKIKEDRRKRKVNLGNKIGMDEEIDKKEVNNAPQTLNASNVCK